LCVLGLANALTGDLPQGWGLRAAAEGWAGGLPAEWLAQSSWPLTTPLLVVILLLFPTGHLPNRRWSTAVWHAAQGWQLTPVTSVEVKGRVGPGGVEGLLVTFERQVG